MRSPTISPCTRIGGQDDHVVRMALWVGAGEWAAMNRLPPTRAVAIWTRAGAALQMVRGGQPDGPYSVSSGFRAATVESWKQSRLAKPACDVVEPLAKTDRPSESPAASE